MTYSKLFEKLRHKPMTKSQFELYIKNIGGLYADLDSEIQLLFGAGAPILMQEHNGEAYYTLSTIATPLQNGVFVFVDIESNGSKPQSSEIIEIGALKVRLKKPYANLPLSKNRFEILDHFESYIYAPQVPENITQLTGISFEDIASAPQAKEVLKKFRIFLADGIFVAHNVNFDYSFLDYHLRQLGLFPLLNPKLCTIDLARRTILAPRYALGFLNEFLGIGTPLSHRAYADALTSFKLFEIAFMMIPPHVHSVQDLLDFSKGKIRYV